MLHTVWVGNIWKGGKTIVGKLDYETLQVKPVKPFEVEAFLDEPTNSLAVYQNTSLDTYIRDSFDTKINGVPVGYHDTVIRVGKYCYQVGYGFGQFELSRKSEWERFRKGVLTKPRVSKQIDKMFVSGDTLIMYNFAYIKHEAGCFIVRGIATARLDQKTVKYGVILKLAEDGELLGTWHTDPNYHAIKGSVQYDDSLVKFYLMQNY